MARQERKTGSTGIYHILVRGINTPGTDLIVLNTPGTEHTGDGSYCVDCKGA